MVTYIADRILEGDDIRGKRHAPVVVVVGVAERLAAAFGAALGLRG